MFQVMAPIVVGKTIREKRKRKIYVMCEINNHLIGDLRHEDNIQTNDDNKNSNDRAMTK